MPDRITILSPNEKWIAVLTYLGEVRFGPAYYSLAIDKFLFEGRTFGDSYLWSPDPCFFAIQEWETTSEGRGPQTQLLLINLDTTQECILSRAERGFIAPRRFENDKLIYTKEYYAPRSTIEFEIEYFSLDRWENLI